MAQIIMTVKELKHLLAKLRPTVDEWAHGIAKRHEAEHVEHKKKLAEIRRMPEPHEIERLVQEKRAEMTAKRSWMRPAVSYDEALKTVQLDLTLEKAREASHQIVQFLSRYREDDHITPVMNYLEALCNRLDLEDRIALSEHETFQIEKAMELYDAANARA